MSSFHSRISKNSPLIQKLFYITVKTKQIKSFKLDPFNLEFALVSTDVAGISEKELSILSFLSFFDKFTEPFSIDVVRDYEDLLFYKTIRSCRFDNVIINTSQENPENILPGVSSASTRKWEITEEHPDYCILKDGLYCKTYTLSMLHDDLPPGWIYGLYQYSDAIRIFVEPVPDGKTQSTIANHKSAAATMSSATGMNSTDNISIIKELVLNKKNQKLFFTRINIVLLAADVSSLRSREKEFLQNTKNIPGIETAKHVQKKLLHGTEGQRILMVSSAFHCLIPFVTSELYEEGGILLGENTMTGNPIRWNINNRINRNTVLASTSGSGKTTLAMMIIHAFEKMHHNAFIFGVDPENEYAVLGQNMGFTCVDYSFGKKMGLDLFKMVPDTFAATETLCNALNVPEVDRIIPNMAATTLANLDISHRSFTKFYEIMEKNETDNHALKYFKMLTIPPYSDFFEGEPPKSNKIILSLKNIGSAGGTVHRLITQIALSYAMGRALLMPKIIPKLFMLDEVWMLLQHDSLGNYIQNLSRRGRKYNINLMMATQNIEDMTDNVSARNVLVNSDTVMFLRQSEATAKSLREHFVLSDNAVSYMMRLNRGQALIKYGNSMVPVNILPDDEQLKLFRPR